jgi:predicted DNA-binding protein
MTSIRLTNDLENNIKNIAKNEGKSKSEIIKIALQHFIEEYKSSLSPFELGKNLFGKYGSGENDNSKNYKKKIKDKISAKFSH